MSTTDRIQEFVTEAGFEIFPLFGGGHTCGLPCEDFVRVVTGYSPVDGLSFLAVFPTKVVRYCLSTPYNHNNWSAHDSRAYGSPGELKATLEAMTQQPQGCWA
jgi:hypothetical protein